MTTGLFVYGTLAPGQSHHHLLNSIGGTWEPAIVRGKLYPDGTPETEGFPVLILDKNGEDITGFLFRSVRLDRHWAELDGYEGDGYARVLTTVRVSRNAAARAYVYVLKR